MAQFESHRAEFETAGARVWYIAAEKRRGMFDPTKFFEKNPQSFPFLLDEDRRVTKAYGIYHRFGIDAWNIARPASFVVGSDGRIKYTFVSQTQSERAPLEEILKALAPAR